MININGLTAAELGIRSEELNNLSELKFYDVKQAPFRIYGLYEPEKPGAFHRMPDSVAEATNPGVRCFNYETAGGRVRFATTSRYMVLHVKNPTHSKMVNMCIVGSSGLDVYMNKNVRDTFIAIAKPPF